MKIWKFLNSRIGSVLVFLVGFATITIIVSTVMFSIGVGWINGNLSKLSEKANDPNSYAVVQNIASGISGSLKKGFSSGSDRQTDQTLEYLNCKKKVGLLDVKMTNSSQKGLEKYLFKVVNNSDQYISQIKVNFTFYNDKGDVLDATNKWLSEIKVLDPGQEIVLSGDRWLRKSKDSEEYEGQSSSVKGQIVSFDIIKITKEK
jgi:hypothetical protein